MKLLAKPPPFGAVCFYPEGSPKAYLVDRRFWKKLTRIRWHYEPGKRRARGFFNKERLYLHRYILKLVGKYFPDVTFANGDHFDCRLVNLKPYDFSEDGSRRGRFRNSKNRKGVSFHKGRQVWRAMIRVHGKLRNLGSFSSAERAAKAYAEAYDLAHPQNAHPVANKREL